MNDREILLAIYDRACDRFKAQKDQITYNEREMLWKKIIAVVPV